MTQFTLGGPPKLQTATGEDLDRWAFLYQAEPRRGAHGTVTPRESDAALRARLLKISPHGGW
jgi:hypothetical protein